MTDSDKEEILVLYGSQTGNSEAAAKQIATLIPGKLSKCSARHMQLDDFLEYEEAKWSRLVIICTSSYGVGQAPLGCYRFRELCDEILAKDGSNKMLDGLMYAMLGLGDSKYTTFFQNPTAIDKALTMAGATRVGSLGKADASGNQLEVIDEWIDGIFSHLEKAVAVSVSGEAADKLSTAQSNTRKMCMQLFPQFFENSSGSGNNNPMVIAAIFVLIVAIIMMFLQQS
mmetsp:Transcript_26915/g.41727  ORF Transcript_26915/g.41727 Transcript_26915/m.41727 type:complete len:228 (-) Transcript_26915:115-798(-)|eukprot:CAMPEP_0196812410 /NCGR_PEP_ID=MMETSP1362-20130617/25520_1 /TAXON_ID=163516 /ORGANISM="Leptocylindrus danicus, Strain CCMP1856" /LENGTH=227 /DNA_ID=CAMNT_0042188047 /DNA_START=43 /DNA_END=726 /DNA_ORIENTATION=+